MDSKGFKHHSGNSVCRDEDCTSLKAYSERRKNKLQENAFIKSGTPYKKIQKFTKSKLSDVPIFFETRPISGQAFCNFIVFQAQNVREKNRKYLNMS
jgi:hypothetical protein